MTPSDVCIWSWNSPALLAENTGLYLSRSVYAKQSGWLQNLWTDAERVYIVQTPVRDTSRCDQRLEAALHWHVGKNVTKCHRQSSCQRRKRLRASMKAKWHHFEHLLNWNLLFSEPTLHNRFFSEPPTVYRGKHVFSRHFHRSYLKANKVSKSEGTRKVKYAYHFWKCADGADRKLSINWPMLVETTASQSWRVFWDTMYNLFVC